MANKDNKTSSKREGNVYDRLFKENIDALFLPLVAQRLEIEIDHYQKLSVELPKTIERKADFLAEVTTKKGEVILLQVEFQTKDDPKLLERMMLYHALLFGKFKKPVKQIVIYLGQKPSKMHTTLKPTEQFEGFELLSLQALEAKTFLEADAPEMILLALLTNYKVEQSQQVLRSILEQLQEKSAPTELRKYLQQLLLLSRIRQLEDLTLKMIEKMPIDYKIEDSILYKKGEEKRTEKILLALKYLKEGKSHEEVASLTGLVRELIEAIDPKD